MKSTLSILALVAAAAADYGYGADPVKSSSTPAKVSSSSKAWENDGYWPKSSSSVKVSSSAKPIKSATWGDDEDCDEWGNPVGPSKATSTKVYGGSWDHPTVQACAPTTTTKSVVYTEAKGDVVITKTLAGGVATYTKDGKTYTTTITGAKSTITKTIGGSSYLTTRTIPGGVATWTGKDGKVSSTSLAPITTTITKVEPYTSLTTVTSCFTNSVITYTMDGKATTKTLDDLTQTWTQTVTGSTTKYYTTSTPASVVVYTDVADPTTTLVVVEADPVATYTSHAEGVVVTKYTTETIYPAGCAAATTPAAPATWGPGGSAAAPSWAAAPVGGSGSAAGWSASPVKPSTTSKVYSPVLATANAASKNGMAGAALVVAAAYALI